MSTASDNNKRIAKNTVMLYIRMLFLMIINLYTSRIVLKALGVEDYGIYNVVGGFVSMFSMISTSLSGAISRFLTFSIAKDSNERLREVFSTSIVIQIILCVLLLLIAETVGLWFINAKMVIPIDRIIAANWVFQISVLTTMVNLFSIPYNSLLIAHERMSAFAYIGIYEGIVKLLIAFIISYSPVDLLVFYALLIFVLSATVRVLYGYYCNSHFPESRFKFILDKSLLKSMFGFAGWNFIGSTSGVLRSQGINILINVFCGPSVNAARAVAMQVNGAVSGFCTNFTTAVRPQITKSYALGDKSTYENLVIKTSKFSFFILMVLFLPIILETDFLLGKWLVDVPEYTKQFVRVILLLTLVESYSGQLIYLLLATGNIKKYQILVGGIQILNFPIAYILLKLGFSPVSTVTSTIFIAAICLITRLILLKEMLQFPMKKYLIDVVLKTFSLFIVCLFFLVIIKNLIGLTGWIQFILNVIIIEAVSFLVIYTMGLSKGERNFILFNIKKFVKK